MATSHQHRAFARTFGNRRSAGASPVIARIPTGTAERKSRARWPVFARPQKYCGRHAAAQNHAAHYQCRGAEGEVFGRRILRRRTGIRRPGAPRGRSGIRGPSTPRGRSGIRGPSTPRRPTGLSALDCRSPVARGLGRHDLNVAGQDQEPATVIENDLGAAPGTGHDGVADIDFHRACNALEAVAAIAVDRDLPFYGGQCGGDGRQCPRYNRDESNRAEYRTHRNSPPTVRLLRRQAVARLSIERQFNPKTANQQSPCGCCGTSTLGPGAAETAAAQLGYAAVRGSAIMALSCGSRCAAFRREGRHMSDEIKDGSGPRASRLGRTIVTAFMILALLAVLLLLSPDPCPVV